MGAALRIDGDEMGLAREERAAVLGVPADLFEAVEIFNEAPALFSSLGWHASKDFMKELADHFCFLQISDEFLTYIGEHASEMELEYLARKRCLLEPVVEGMLKRKKGNNRACRLLPIAGLSLEMRRKVILSPNVPADVRKRLAPPIGLCVLVGKQFEDVEVLRATLAVSAAEVLRELADPCFELSQALSHEEGSLSLLLEGVSKEQLAADPDLAEIYKVLRLMRAQIQGLNSILAKRERALYELQERALEADRIAANPIEILELEGEDED
jgi:hypothetical protein